MPINASSQNDSISLSSVDAGCDLASRYIWRGTDYGHSPGIQPWLSASYKIFTLGAWGSYTVNDSRIQETDFYLDIAAGDLFTLSVWDYFSPCDTVYNNKYFEYSRNKTGHTFESILQFNGTEKFPLRILAGYNFFGADPDNSIYCELGYSTTYHNVDLDFFAGFSPKTGIYGDEFSVCNVGLTCTKTVPVSAKFTLPLYMSLITNLETENIFLVAGCSF